MDRRAFNKTLTLAAAGMLLPMSSTQATTFLSVEQARKILWADTPMEPLSVTLTKEQMKSIKKAAKVRVRYAKMRVWKSKDGGLFILDHIIGKHENIDVAVALNNNGEVKGIEILTYRETYGDEIRNDKWRAQFHGRDHSEHLKLDQQIKNISGATLSCRHITDGINRLTQTWNQVLRHL